MAWWTNGCQTSNVVNRTRSSKGPSTTAILESPIRNQFHLQMIYGWLSHKWMTAENIIDFNNLIRPQSFLSSLLLINHAFTIISYQIWTTYKLVLSTKRSISAKKLSACKKNKKKWAKIGHSSFCYIHDLKSYKHSTIFKWKKDLRYSCKVSPSQHLNYINCKYNMI